MQRKVERIARQARTWASDTEAVLRTCEQLVDYFGTAKERRAIDASFAAAHFWVQAAAVAAAAPDEAEFPQPGAPDHVAFSCGRATAEILSPLLQLVVEPVPEFIVSTRKNLDEETQRKIVRPFAQFSAVMGRYVCKPVWSLHPDLAPDGWPL